MEVGVIKLGSRISFNANDTSGGNGEARSIIKMLHGGGCGVHIFTKILKKDNLIPDFTWHDLQDTVSSTLFKMDQLDALIVLNGNVNFFGGAEDPEQLINYEMINKFMGPVFYIYCDPELTLKQVWPSVEKKPWASNWSADRLNIKRTDIVYISQPYDVDIILEELGKNEVVPASIHHFPFEKFPCLNEQLPFNKNPEVDLSYGGTMRGGKRAKKMVKFYFGHPEDISVEMFGKIDLDDFTKIKSLKLDTTLRAPTFTGPVRYDEMLPKMNRAMAHCVIGDPFYEQINDMAQRAYESIWSNVVTFIDTDLDKIRRVYGADKNLADFLYVSTREELSEKIQLLKQSPETRREIVEAQIKAIAFDAGDYCVDFVTLLEVQRELWKNR
jgi:hypothetical protein